MSDPSQKQLKAFASLALSSEYHKAHKQLMLWSTILFIWELVGVNLDKAKDAGGNIGPVVTALKSPQAVPWVLLTLVLYFLFKCSVEWAQCHVERRKVRFARVDFYSAWLVALASIALYAVQAFSRIQLANAVTPVRVFSFELAFFSFLGFLLAVRLGFGWRKALSGFKSYYAVSSIVFLSMAVGFGVILFIPKVGVAGRDWRAGLAGALSGALIYGFVLLRRSRPWEKFKRIVRRSLWRSLPKKSGPGNPPA